MKTPLHYCPQTMRQIYQDKDGKLHAVTVQEARMKGTSWESNVPRVKQKASPRARWAVTESQFYQGAFYGSLLALALGVYIRWF